MDAGEAVIVRRIYREFLAGRSQQQIARSLEAEGVGPLEHSTHIARFGLLRGSIWAAWQATAKGRPTTGRPLERTN